MYVARALWSTVHRTATILKSDFQMQAPNKERADVSADANAQRHR